MRAASAGSISPMTWLGILYVPYLVVLLLVPLLARWLGSNAHRDRRRGGARGSRLLFAARVPRRCCKRAPAAGIDRHREAVAGTARACILQLVAFAIIPALAALIGGALSVLWSRGARVVRMMRARVEG